MPVVLAPAEVLAGLIAVCALLCAVLIANIVKAILGSVNVFGILSPILSALDWFASHALSAMSWLWDKTNPVAVWIALTNVLHATEQGLHGVVFGDITNSLRWLYSTAIPRAANWALGQALAAVAGARSLAYALYNTAVADVNAVRNWATSAINAAQAYVLGQLTIAVNTLRSDIAGVWQAAQALVATVRSDLAALHQFVNTTVLGRIGAVEQEIAVEIPRIEAEIGQIATVAIPALTLAITAVRDIVTEVERCTAPICESGTAQGLSNLEKLLRDLGPLVEGGILFALLAEAVRDPIAVGHEIESVIGGTVNEAASVLRSAIAA